MCQSVFCQGDVNDRAANAFDSNPVADGVAWRAERKSDKK